jgi:hypothetical protein
MLRTASAFNMTSVIFWYLLPWPLANSLDYTLCWSTHRHAAGGSARLEHTQALRSWLSQSRAHAGTWLMAPLASSTRKHFARGSHNPEPTQALGSWLRSTRAHASPWHAARGSDGLEHMQARRHAQRGVGGRQPHRPGLVNRMASDTSSSLHERRPTLVEASTRRDPFSPGLQCRCARCR